MKVQVKRSASVVWKWMFIGLIAFMSSCKTGNVIQRDKPEKDVRLKPISISKLLKRVEMNDVEYNTLESKRVSVKMDLPTRSQSFRSTFKLQKDSVIILSAQKATIPVGKLKLTPDTLELIYYIDKEYYHGDLDYLSKRFSMDLSFDLIQAFFSGGLVSYREDPRRKDFRNFQVVVSEGQYVLQSINKRKFRKVQEDQDKLQRYINKYDDENFIVQRIYINPNDYLTTRIEVIDFDNETTSNIYMKEYTDVDGQILPTLVEADFKAKGVSKGNIEIKISKIEVDSNPRFIFSIPKKYERKPLN